jgi:hypothetical protein
MQRHLAEGLAAAEAAALAAQLDAPAEDVSRPPAEARQELGTAHHVTRIAMRYFPWGVAVGDDGVWVTVRGKLDG